MSFRKALKTNKGKSSEIEKRKSDKRTESVRSRNVTIGSVYHEGHQMTQEDVLAGVNTKNQSIRSSADKTPKQHESKNKCKRCLGACFREFCEFLNTCIDSLC